MSWQTVVLIVFFGLLAAGTLSILVAWMMWINAEKRMIDARRKYDANFRRDDDHGDKK